jgi:hypothetical protein
LSESSENTYNGTSFPKGAYYIRFGGRWNRSEVSSTVSNTIYTSNWRFQRVYAFDEGGTGVTTHTANRLVWSTSSASI